MASAGGCLSQQAEPSILDAGNSVSRDGQPETEDSSAVMSPAFSEESHPQRDYTGETYLWEKED